MSWELSGSWVLKGCLCSNNITCAIIKTRRRSTVKKYNRPEADNAKTATPEAEYCVESTGAPTIHRRTPPRTTRQPMHLRLVMASPNTQCDAARLKTNTVANIAPQRLNGAKFRPKV